MKNKYTIVVLLATLVTAIVFAASIMQATKALPAVGTKEHIGKIDDLDIEIVVQSPSAEETSLQIVCLFEYTEGDIYTSPPALPKESNGMVHVDEAFHGLITELRKTNKFEGKFLKLY